MQKRTKSIPVGGKFLFEFVRLRKTSSKKRQLLGHHRLEAVVEFLVVLGIDSWPCEDPNSTPENRFSREFAKGLSRLRLKYV